MKTPKMHRSIQALALAAALLLGAQAAAHAQQPAADPSDVASPDAIITAVYDVISGDAGEARDWNRWYSLFTDGATLSAVALPIPDDYIGTIGAQP